MKVSDLVSIIFERSRYQVFSPPPQQNLHYTRKGLHAMLRGTSRNTIIILLVFDVQRVMNLVKRRDRARR